MAKILETILHGLASPQARAQYDAKQQEQKDRSQRFTKLVSAFDELGWLPKEVAMTKSLEQLEGVFEGKQLLGKLGETELKNKLTKLQIAQQEREAESEQSFSRAIGDATTTATPSAPGLIPQPQTATAPLTRTRLLEAFRQNPQAANSPAGRTLLQQALEQEGHGSSPYQPEAFSVGGLKGIVSPRTGSIHVDGQSTTGMTFEQRIQLMDRAALLKRKETLTKAMNKTAKELDELDPNIRAHYFRELRAIETKLAGQPGGTPPPPVDPNDPLGLRRVE